jgi:phosphoglycolate phosphatase
MTAVPPRALLFDWDNTLVDTWPTIHHALAVTFREMGREPWTLEQTRARVRESARDSFPELFGERAAEAADTFYRTFEADHLERLKERPGAAEMLGRLDAAGYYLAVVSNKRGDLLRKEAQSLGWTALFVRLVGANDATRDKPAEEPVQMAAVSHLARRSGSSAIRRSTCCAPARRVVCRSCCARNRRRPASSAIIRRNATCQTARRWPIC